VVVVRLEMDLGMWFVLRGDRGVCLCEFCQCGICLCGICLCRICRYAHLFS
jgi:hypothetical protein